jgi:hypothetical protein
MNKSSIRIAALAAALVSLPAWAGEHFAVVERPYLDTGDSMMAVTGGTGKYVGAKGSMKLHPRDPTPTAYDFTYDLL